MSGVKHVPYPDGIHHHSGVVAEVCELIVVVSGVKAAVCDHDDRHFGSGSLAVPDEVIIGVLQSRGGEGAPSNPPQIFHCSFECSHGVYVWVIETNALKGPVVTVLYNSNSCA